MQQGYWSVRDAAWLPPPRPPDPLETPWSWHARPCPGWQPRCTAAADLRWLPRARGAVVPAQRGQEVRPVPVGT